MPQVAAGYSTVDRIAGMFPTFKRPPAWEAGTSYPAGYTIRDANGNQQQAPTSGGPFVSASVEPGWNSTIGATTTDGPAGSTFSWTNKGGLPAQQSVTDAQIVTYAADIQGDIDACLQRRFSESIASAPYNGSFAAWVAALSVDALNVLEQLSRYGAAAELGDTLATLGNQTADKFAARFRADYDFMLHEIAGEDATGKKRPQGGMYDALFDPLAAHEAVRPALEGIAGGDQPRDVSPYQEGLSNMFGKFQRKQE
ncbi:MAG TPA: hypothetical protein VGZ29_05755 [Terriglobia bacterium]|nr:hypothetical protein [Terriglobia bacterium]